MKKKLSYGERIALLAGLGGEDDFPEDLDEETGAKVIDEYESEEETTKSNKSKQVKRSSLRAKNVKLLDELDERYAGTKTSRRKLQLAKEKVKEVGGGLKGLGKLKEAVEEVDNSSEDEEDDADSAEDLDDSFDVEEVLSNEGEKGGSDDDDDDLEDDDEDQSEDEDDEDVDGGEFAGDMFQIESGDENEDNENEAVSDDQEDVVKTMSSSASNAQKAMACQNQLRMWDALLEVRIRMQRMLLEANKLPQLNMLNEAVGDASKPNVSSSAEKCRQGLRDLLTKLLNLQELLVSQNPEVSKSLSGKKRKADVDEEEIPSDEEITSSEDEKGSGDEEENLGLSKELVRKSNTNLSTKTAAKPKKKKMKIEDLESTIQSQFQSLIPFRNDTIQKWNEKTQVSFGKYGKKTHEISTLKQIDHILSNKEKLLKRTRVKRSAYETIGKQQKQEDDVENESDHEIFDDDDFYHQLLRELIERKTSNVSDPVQLSRHWLELQKMRSKLKKKVDTKASKGRKIRYDVHNKLVNFMAPEDNCPMSDNAIKELINSLFGKMI